MDKMCGKDNPNQMSGILENLILSESHLVMYVGSGGDVTSPFRENGDNEETMLFLLFEPSSF